MEACVYKHFYLMYNVYSKTEKAFIEIISVYIEVCA